MEWYEWLLITVVWMLIPLCLFVKAKQEDKIRRWQAEDKKEFAKFVKGVANAKR